MGVTLRSPTVPVSPVFLPTSFGEKAANLSFRFGSGHQHPCFCNLNLCRQLSCDLHRSTFDDHIAYGAECYSPPSDRHKSLEAYNSDAPESAVTSTCLLGKT